MKFNLKTLAFFLASAILTSIVPFTAHAAAHGVGTNISSSDGTVYMITLGGQRRPYTSAGAFLSYGFNSWASVVPANSDDLALPVGQFIPPQSGKVFCSDKGSDIGTCYVISSSAKIGIPSEAIFTGLGYSFSRALYGDASFLPQTSVLQSSATAHSVGTLVNNNSTVYIVGDSGLLGFPSLSVFASWGFNFLDVVPANEADKALSVTGVAAARQYGMLAPLPTTPGLFEISDPTPASGPVGSTVTIHGNGWFVSNGNTVRFGNGSVDSTYIDANTLTFNVPASLSSGSCPPPMACPLYIQAVIPGTYNVDVENSNGRANVVAFTVTENSSAVSISSLLPSSGPTGTLVTIKGTGFTSANNLVNFSSNTASFWSYPGTYSASLNADGTSLTFSIPLMDAPGCADACPHRAPLPTPPGVYQISVTNTTGTSNILNFTVTQ